MRKIVLRIEPFPVEQIPDMLKKHGILINHYAEEFFAHPRFSMGHSGETTVTMASLQEIGLKNGATISEILTHLPQTGLKACAVNIGLFLRLAWADQPQSQNSILSGTHGSPDQAVTVLSEILEQDDAFPKGLYLRNVDGNLWLRGYVCDCAYRFPGDAMFAFENDPDLCMLGQEYVCYEYSEKKGKRYIQRQGKTVTA